LLDEHRKDAIVLAAAKVGGALAKDAIPATLQDGRLACSHAGSVGSRSSICLDSTKAQHLVLMHRSKRPWGLTCSHVSGVSALRSGSVNRPCQWGWARTFCDDPKFERKALRQIS
jgi:hypothetical protein